MPSTHGKVISYVINEITESEVTVYVLWIRRLRLRRRFWLRFHFRAYRSIIHPFNHCWRKLLLINNEMEGDGLIRPALSVIHKCITTDRLR